MKKPFCNDRVDYILNLLEPSKKDKVLVIGISNTPEIEMEFEDKVKECWIVDIDSKKLKKAKVFLKKSKLIHADVTKIDLPKNYFTKIIMLEVLEHLENDYDTLKRLNSLLKDNGDLILAVPNNAFLHIINPLRYTQHKRHYNNKQINKLLKRAGFSIKHFNIVENWSMFFNLYVHLFYKFILNKSKEFLTIKKIPGRTYGQINKKGLDLIIKASKIK